MSTQYDAIGTKYNRINGLPAQRIQHDAVENALLPILAGAKVLDLACGTGFYSNKLIAWGAEHVTAIDISAGMITAANAALPENMREKIKFLVADCSTPEMWQSPDLKGKEGTFDIVLAAWFLNYAATEDEMQRMFANIYTALKPGGKLVALTIYPKVMDMFVPNDPVVESEKHYEMFYEVVERTQDRSRMKLKTVGEPYVEFDFFYFGFEAYRNAAAGAGMGEIEWEPVMPNGQWIKQMGEQYWEAYHKRPKCALCTGTKPTPTIASACST